MALLKALGHDNQPAELRADEDKNLKVVTYDESARSELLFSGYVDWAQNEDALKYIDIQLDTVHFPALAILSVRNGSSEVDLAVSVGTMRACRISTSPAGAVAVTPSAGTDTFTAADHKLRVGDAITFAGAGGGVTAGVTYYVISVADANTFQISTTRGGAAFNVADNTANTCTIAFEFFEYAKFTVPKYASASSTATVQGLKEVIIEGYPNTLGGCRIYFAKSVAIAAGFEVYVEIRKA